MQNAPSDFLAIERIPPLTYAFIFGQQGQVDNRIGRALHEAIDLQDALDLFRRLKRRERFAHRAAMRRQHPSRMVRGFLRLLELATPNNYVGNAPLALAPADDCPAH
jgi:hypothetical protein